MSNPAYDQGIDHTLAFMKEGYTFFLNRFRRYQADVFQTRLMMQKATCVMGEDAARMFYAPGRFTRKFAIPPTALFLLQDVGSVMLRDREHHHIRKRMFMSLMTPESIQRLTDLTHEQWQWAISVWGERPQIVLQHEAEEILFRAVCEWAGILPLEEEAKQRAHEFSAMIDGAGSMGLRALTGMILRSRSEKWARNIIKAVRQGDIKAPEDSAVHVISNHHDSGGKKLDINTAAVELINVLRPTVAVARYVTFAATALESHPEWKQKLSSANDELIEAFVQEVRRYYPFFPVVGGRALETFDWHDIHFKRGDWVLLDLYGTNHDDRIWTEPERFRPERFLNWEGNPYTLIPQGGGDFYTGHRCPGEWITIELVKMAVRLLTCEIDYVVPPQDLRVSLSRMPAIPASRFILKNARKRQGLVLSTLRRTDADMRRYH